jgi:hypothetical protein
MRASHRIMLWIGGIFSFVILVNPLFSQSYSLQGRVYSGNTGLEPPNSTPIPNVPVILWGANTSGVKVSPPIDNTTTDGSGWYSLDVDIMVDAFDFYIIEEVDLSGYYSVGATTVGGSKLSDNLIQYTFMELTGGDKTGNKFWDKPLAPDMDVYGNGVKIDDGSTTPSSADDTDFGSVNVSGGSISKTYTIENNGTATLNITGASLSGSGDFTVTSQPASSLAPDDGTTFTVKFDPGTAGTHTATVNIANNSSENPYDFAVRGTGITTSVPAPEIDVRGNGISIPDGDTTPETADGTDMGSVEVGSGSVTKMFTVHNTGTDTLRFIGYEINPDVAKIGGQTAAQFDITPAVVNIKIPPGGSVQIGVECYPLLAGTYLTTLSIVSNDADEDPYDFSIRCTGFESQQYEWDFGDAPEGFMVNTTYDYPTTLANNGARHKIVPGGPWIGDATGKPDAEPDGQPKNAFMDDGKDEDPWQIKWQLAAGVPGYVEFPVGVGGYVDIWIDYDDDGRFAHPAERVFSGMLNAGPCHVDFNVPGSAHIPQVYARIRINSQGPLPPWGPADDGEVEDHFIIIWPADFGDAPDPPYPTRLSSNGAWFTLYKRSPFFGSPPGRDGDADGQPDPQAKGDDLDGNDDEDGIDFLTTLLPGSQAKVRITIQNAGGGPGQCRGWIDFNHNGKWDNSQNSVERIVDYPIASGFSLREITFAVPGDAQPGAAFARFIVTTGQPEPTGGSVDEGGEVEDYQIIIGPDGPYPEEVQWDFGDAPELPERGYHYPTTLAHNGARHRIVRNGPWLGGGNFSRPDAEPDGQPDPDALLDDQTDMNDENDIHGDLTTCTAGEIWIAVASGGITEIWVDFNADGMWQHPAEQVFSGYLSAGIHHVSVTPPPNTVPGKTYMRGRISSTGGLTPEGPADDGEVVDALVHIYPVDFGDAPDKYHTRLASGGAYQLADPDELRIGNTVDGETDGQPGALAVGDDQAGGDDEDGVIFLTPLVPGQPAMLQITSKVKQNGGFVLDGWIDYDQNGQFNEKIVHRVYIITSNTPVITPVQTNVPVNAVEGLTYARFRVGQGIGMMFTQQPDGPGPDPFTFGEVEDYAVIIGEDGPLPPESNRYDFGDAPATYGDAWHKLGGPWFGKLDDCPDWETSAHHDLQAMGDDQDGNDDEDGLVYVNMVSGQQYGMIYFDIIPGPSGDVSIASWVDLNANGNWMDPGESMGTIHFTFGPMPSNGWKHHYTCWWQLGDFTQAKPGKTVMRLRIVEGLKDALSADGEESSGEVEDHELEIKADGNPVPPGGVVFGTKWNDQNGDGFWDTNEPVLPDWEIWLDANQNGVEDPGDQYDTTDTSGKFSFYGLSAGQYTVAEKMQPGWTQTWPKGSGKHIVTVDPAKPGLGILFGNRKAEPDTGTAAVKWSQPPLFNLKGNDTTCYRGWQESSVFLESGVADDWFCSDPNPVTRISWWGGYAEWDSLIPPAEAPSFFHIGIWTDVSRDSLNPFSHPGTMIQEWFAGRLQTNETVDKPHQVPESMEKPFSSFSYTFVLPEDSWFYQEGDSTVYWLAIEAVYDEIPESHHWGWLTRDHYFNDNMIRITRPPGSSPGAVFEAGEPLAELWDLAFILRTTENSDRFDFGDAPDIGYGSTFEKNGAQHLVGSGIYLGQSVDTEPNGQPDNQARGDDSDSGPDEDGIQFLNDLIPGEMAGIQVTASAPGLLNAWIDFNGDSTWNQPEEHVLTDAPLSSGTRLVEFPVAGTARPGETFARFRFSTWPGIRVRGFAGNGEVEDYRVTIGATSSTPAFNLLPAAFRLHQNYPNPFNPRTIIRFEIPYTGAGEEKVHLLIYNLLGQCIRTLVDESKLPGVYDAQWEGLDDNGNQAATGIYLVRFQTGSFTAVKKLILMK